MARGVRFVVSVLWLVLVVYRVLAVLDGDSNANYNLRLAPKKFFVEEVSSSAVICDWRQNPRLQPLPRCRCGCTAGKPNLVYWLLLLAGDVELNPGPIKFPCAMCSKPVRHNQKGIQCSRCENWSHTACCGVTDLEYRRIGEREEELMFCLGCLSR